MIINIILIILMALPKFSNDPLFSTITCPALRNDELPLIRLRLRLSDFIIINSSSSHVFRFIFINSSSSSSLALSLIRLRLRLSGILSRRSRRSNLSGRKTRHNVIRLRFFPRFNSFSSFSII